MSILWYIYLLRPYSFWISDIQYFETPVVYFEYPTRLRVRSSLKVTVRGCTKSRDHCCRVHTIHDRQYYYLYNLLQFLRLYFDNRYWFTDLLKSVLPPCYLVKCFYIITLYHHWLIVCHMIQDSLVLGLWLSNNRENVGRDFWSATNNTHNLETLVYFFLGFGTLVIWCSLRREAREHLETWDRDVCGL